MLMTLFTGAFLVFIGMMFISGMSGSSLESIEQVFKEPDNPSFLSVLRILTTLNQIGAFLVATWLFMRVFGKDSVEGLYFKSFNPKLWLIIPLAMLSASPVIDVFMHLNNWFIPEGSWVEAMFKPMEDEGAVITQALLTMDDPGTLIFNLLIIAVLPAIGEELAFRGVLQNQIAKSTKNIHTAIWISAFIFSAYHMQFYGFIPRLLLGAFFGYLVVWTGSIWPSIIAHLVNNTSAIVAMYYAQSSEDLNLGELPQMDASPDFLFAGIGAIILTLCLFLVWRENKWNEIKERYLAWSRMDLFDDKNFLD